MSSDEILDIASISTPYFRTQEFSDIIYENEKVMLEFLNEPKESKCIFLT